LGYFDQNVEIWVKKIQNFRVKLGLAYTLKFWIFFTQILVYIYKTYQKRWPKNVNSALRHWQSVTLSSNKNYKSSFKAKFYPFSLLQITFVINLIVQKYDDIVYAE